MNLLSSIIKPLRNNWIFIISVAFFISFPDIWFYITAYNSTSYAIYLFLQSFIIAYCISFCISVIPSGRIKLFATYFSLVLAALIFLVDFICVFQHQSRFNADFVEIVLGTNVSEASEFFLTFMSLQNILLYIGAFTIIFVLLLLNQKERRLPKPLVILGLFILLFSGFLCYRNNTVWKDGVIGKFKSLVSYDIPDLHDYLTHPNIVYGKKDLPENVVLIIGESLSKHHCSIYGYEKETNPLLKSLRNSSLTVYNNVTSPATATINSFKYMMSTFSVEETGKTNWYVHTTLPEIMNQTGYKTHWLSNQAQGGNTIINCFVDLCSDYEFNGDRFAGDERKTFDGDLIKMADPIIRNNEDSLNFYVFHLMGSHFKFDLRYPTDYSYFTENDYTDKKENQRSVLAAYDNSVYYNDYVVFKLMQLFKDEDAVVIYLSDHALDIFYTDDTYAAHAKVNDPVSVKYGTEIPFLIYTSPLFDRKHPETSQRIKLGVDSQYRTDDLIYTIMDIMGIESIDNTSIKDKSILYDYAE